jgi:hypothetical protein
LEPGATYTDHQFVPVELEIVLTEIRRRTLPRWNV